jgi:hypothetical protein
MRIEAWQNLVRKQGRVIAGALLFLGILVVRHWVVTPHLASLQASQQYEYATSEHIKKSTMMNNKVRAARTRLEKLIVQCAGLSEGVFGPAEAEAFLGGLETLCAQSGCTVAALSFLGAEDRRNSDGASTIVARGAALTVHGPYGGAVRLIESLQARRERVWIDKLRITTPAPDASQVACHLTITIYVNLDEENVDDDNGPIPD